MRISDFPESPGRNLLMRLEYLDDTQGEGLFDDFYRLSRDARMYYLIMLANYVAESIGDRNQDIGISHIIDHFERATE